MVTLLYIVIAFILVFANGFFVASEFALVGVRRSRIQTLAESGNTRARRLLNLIDNLNAYVSATQLGITMASLARGWIGEPVFAHLLEAPLKGRVSELTLHTVSFALALEPGDSIANAAGVFHVERVENRRISRVRFLPAAVKEQSKPFSRLSVLGMSSLAMKTEPNILLN